MAEVVARRSNPLAPLTDAEIRGLTLPGEGRLVLRDPAFRGLELRLTPPSARNPHGTRTWSLELKAAGRQRRFTIGRYPEVTLSEARRKAGKLRAEALEGRDPVEERREARRVDRLKRAGAANASDVRALLDSFERLAARARGLRSWAQQRQLIESNFGALLDKAPADLTRADFRSVLDAAVSRDAPISGKRAARYLGRVLSWAVERELIETNPVLGLKFDELTRPERIRQRVLSDDEIRKLWPAAKTGGVFGDLARLYVLTGLRRQEAAGLRWTDLDGGIALIGGTKSGQPHRLPLSRAAQAIIEAQPKRGEFVFMTPSGALAESVSNNWHRACARLAKASGTADWTWHDLRRTCRTLLARIGTDDLVAELILNHALPGKLRRTYVLHRYEEEMREALERLAAFLDKIVSGEANVVRLRPAG
jgi:integrase